MWPAGKNPALLVRGFPAQTFARRSATQSEMRRSITEKAESAPLFGRHLDHTGISQKVQ
jgi:hypothetical protein